MEIPLMDRMENRDIIVKTQNEIHLNGNGALRLGEKNSEPPRMEKHKTPEEEFAAKTPSLCEKRYLSKDYVSHSSSGTPVYDYFQYKFNRNWANKYFWDYQLTGPVTSKWPLKDNTYASEVSHPGRLLLSD